MRHGWRMWRSTVCFAAILCLILNASKVATLQRGCITCLIEQLTVLFAARTRKDPCRLNECWFHLSPSVWVRAANMNVSSSNQLSPPHRINYLYNRKRSNPFNAFSTLIPKLRYSGAITRCDDRYFFFFCATKRKFQSQFWLANYLRCSLKCNST